MKVQLVSITVLFLLSGWWLAQPVRGLRTTLVVNDSSDASDNKPGDGVCDVSEQSGSQCTLRAAIEELNQHGPGLLAHRIEFGLAGPGPFVFTPATAYPAITVPVIIDGTSQPTARCPGDDTTASLHIVLDGRNAGPEADGLLFDENAAASTVQGLVTGNFSGNGIRLLGDSNSIRCTYVGVASDGRSPLGNGQAGILIEGDFNSIGDFSAPGNRNVISANRGPGILIDPGQFNVVANNFVGTTADGHNPLSNLGGIQINGAHNTVGQLSNLDKATARPANVISGNSGFGIRVTASETTILGNAVGLAADGGRPLPNDGNGIELLGTVSNTTVGGETEGEANLIAHNSGAGLLIAHRVGLAGSDNLVRSNAIFENGGPGIDLQYGEERSLSKTSSQERPVLATTPGSSITLSLQGHSNTRYLVDVYGSPSCDPSGNGEGRQLLQTVPLTTGDSGSVALELGELVNTAAVITAQSTGPDGNSSEFSNCVSAATIGTANE